MSKNFVEDEDFPSPDARYQATGTFDAFSYDYDIEKFPECFDQNGWPKFGEYDRYGLDHPITGRPWYDRPRIPDANESDSSYSDWFEIAQHLETMQAAHVELVGPHGEVDGLFLRDANFDDAIFHYHSPEAVANNLAYIKKHVLPRLLTLLHARRATSEFARLWGTYCSIHAVVEPAVERRAAGHAGRVQGRILLKDAQVKWYVKFRELHQRVVGCSALETETAFIDLVHALINRLRLLPPGFDIQWFQGAAGQEVKDGKFVRFQRTLPYALKRASAHGQYHKFLTASLDDPPAVPPIELDAYPLIAK